MQIIGIIGAMDEEIDAYRSSMVQKTKKSQNGFEFYIGTIQSKDVILVKSGVGKVFASMVTQLMIDKYHVESIIVTGVGGSLNSKLNIGDVLIGRDSIQYDFDATALGFKLGQISYTDYRIFPADKLLLKIANNCKIEHNTMEGRILTGDQFMTYKDKQDKRYLVKELKGDCVEMEGAAVAQVCTVNNVPHLIIRTMSDKADGTAVSDYNQFKNIVAKNSYNLVSNIISNLK